MTAKNNLILTSILFYTEEFKKNVLKSIKGVIFE